MQPQPSPSVQNYILLAPSGSQPLGGSRPSVGVQRFLASLQVNEPIRELYEQNDPDGQIVANVIDSTRDGLSKLVQLSEEALLDLRALHPGLLIVPEQFYYPQRLQYTIENQYKKANQRVSTFKIVVQDAKTRKPVPGALVVAFANRTGDQAETDANGEARLTAFSGQTNIDQLFIYPKVGYWSFFQRNRILLNGDTFSLRAVTLPVADARQFFHPGTGPKAPTLDTGAGIRVGIIDTGVGPHPDLRITKGKNLVVGENPADFFDADEHGTHVAGVVAARGNAPNRLTGLAPGVELFAYRVFGRNPGRGASTFAIQKAIEEAIADRCDIINMSLGGGAPDKAIEQALTDAFMNGLVAFVATGNDGRQPVSFPASFSLSIGVGAMGRRNTFPRGTTDDLNLVKPPRGTDALNYVAAFSNIGREVDLIAPGIAIVSTVPGGYMPMSGTSMACPVATGVAAQLLATRPDLLAMPRNADRSAAMIRFLVSNVRVLGFGATFEGNGLLMS
ncbi:MAG: peptidase S8/S53 subtilisin kexin sedolisin [Cytophagales bacterium]|nr:MAG: peptidase S8/S53 subtilisin kexin sedolisin [Cytophagales bacterium]